MEKDCNKLDLDEKREGKDGGNLVKNRIKWDLRSWGKDKIKNERMESKRIEDERRKIEDGWKKIRRIFKEKKRKEEGKILIEGKGLKIRKKGRWNLRIKRCKWKKVYIEKKWIWVLKSNDKINIWSLERV